METRIDHLQHVDRGRRPRGHDRTGPGDLRLPRRPPARAGRPDKVDAVEYWDSLRTDEGAVYDREVHIDASTLTPFITWGTNPGQGLPLGANVPEPADIVDGQALAAARALEYMDLAVRALAGGGQRRIRRLVHQRSAWRIYARWPRSSRAARWPTACAC